MTVIVMNTKYVIQMGLKTGTEFSMVEQKVPMLAMMRNLENMKALSCGKCYHHMHSKLHRPSFACRLCAQESCIYQKYAQSSLSESMKRVYSRVLIHLALCLPRRSNLDHPRKK